MTKIYGIYGVREANICIPLGNGRNSMQREFTRGNPQQGAYYRPATYMSVTKAEQDMIESSPLFGKKIKLVRTCDDGEQQEEQRAAESPKPTRTERRASGPVKIVQPVETTTPVTQTAPVTDPDPQTDGEFEVHEEITTREELVAFLKTRGAKATVLASDEKIAQFIADQGFSFPNLNM